MIDVRMADLSEEQVAAADAALSSKKALVDKEKESVKDLLNVLLDHVSEEDRMLLTLKEVQGLSLKELSVIYEVNTNALKVRLFRARKRVLDTYNELAAKNEV